MFICVIDFPANYCLLRGGTLKGFPDGQPTPHAPASCHSELCRPGINLLLNDAGKGGLSPDLCASRSVSSLTCPDGGRCFLTARVDVGQVGFGGRGAGKETSWGRARSQLQGHGAWGLAARGERNGQRDWHGHPEVCAMTGHRGPAAQCRELCPELRDHPCGRRF